MGACLSTPAAAEAPAPAPAPAPPLAEPPTAPKPPADAPEQQQGQQGQEAQVAQFPVMTVQDAPVRPPWASRTPSDAMDGSIPPPMGVGVRQQGRSTTAEAVRMNLSEVCLALLDC